MIEKLRASLTIKGWQPIKTAPKDGTPVLLLDGEMIGIFYWEARPGSNYFGKPMPPTWMGAVVIGEFVSTNITDRIVTIQGSDATHWMPLPAVEDAKP